MTTCPKCDSETLVKTEALGNIPLDVCPGCHGIWFDKGELEALLKQSQGEVPAGFELLSPKPEGLPCPRCKSRMSRGGLVNPMLLVDKCESCGGVWLDPRELALVKKLLGLTGGAESVEVERPAPAPAAPPEKKNRFLKYTLALAALIGLAMVSYELYVYFSPEGSVTGHFSAGAASFGFLMLVGGGIGTIKVK
ncbi:MAG TPA: hypothetical protein DDW67_01660 [Elusimicrobia bacterium]|nr:hypothetical protein [Elusimicrobiota bacterium]